MAAPPPLTGAFPHDASIVGGPQMPNSLLVTGLLDYAARWHSAQTVTSLAADGSVESVHTYASVRARAHAASVSLVQKLGVRPGAVIGTLALNSEPHLAAWYAAAGAGAVLHSLNPRLFEDDLVWIAAHARDEVVLFDAELAPLVAALRPRLPAVRHWVVLRGGDLAPPPPAAGGAVLCWERDLVGSLAASPPPRQPHAPLPPWPAAVPETAAAGLCYTSGTTGRPKGVVYTHRSNVLHALASSLADGFGLAATDAALVVVPLCHANAWGFAHAAPLVGAALILPGRATDGAALARACAEQRPTLVAAVPTVFLGLTAHLRSSGTPAGPAALGGRVRAAFIGGAACPPSLIAELEGRWGVRVRHVWGMTELSPVGTVSGDTPATARLSGADRDALTAKQGRPAPLLDARIVDPDTRAALPHDGKARGELQVRGPFVVHSYVRAEASALDGAGYFSTGDIAVIDADGWVTLVDRSKDLVKSGGEFISSAQLEAAATSPDAGVAEAAVIGVPDAKYGERPLLLVVPADPSAPPTPERVQSFLKGKVVSWWVPERVVVVPDIPHTATGKINKVALREKYGGGVGAGVSKL